MKRLIIFILCALISAAMLTACADNAEQNNALGDNSTPDEIVDPQEPIEGGMMIANPWKNHASAEEAFDATGFEIAMPEIEGYSITNYRTMSGELIEIIYSSGQDTITIRKAIGTEDISGDYTAYTEEMEADVADNKCVTFKGQNGSVKVCTWVCGEYSYSVNFEVPVLQEYAQNIVLAVE